MTWVAEADLCAPVIEVDLTRPPENPVCTSPCCSAPPATTEPPAAVGNPILPLSGRKVEVVDLGLSLAGWPLRLTYDSSFLLPTRAGPQGLDVPVQHGIFGFGPGWHGSWHRRRAATDRFETHLTFLRGDGRWTAWRAAANGYETLDPRVTDALNSSGHVYVDRTRDAVESYAGDAWGLLQSVQFAQGGQVQLRYGQASGRSGEVVQPELLTEVVDGFGRSVRFSYSAVLGQPQVTHITGPAGEVYQLAYDEQGVLSVLTWPDGTQRRFHYGAPQGRALVGVTDEEGTRLSTIGYDAQGRAVSTQRALGTQRHTVSWAQPPVVHISEAYDPARGVVVRTRTFSEAPQARVTRGNGSQAQWVADPQHPHIVAWRSQPAGSGCEASVSTQRTDAWGNITQSDDFNGNRTCMAYDTARGLQTVRVEGLAGGSGGASCAAVLAPGATLPPGARKFTRQWHPLWRLPLREAGPGVITQWTYHGQTDGATVASCVDPLAPPLLQAGPSALPCRQTRQATTDATGAAGLLASAQPGSPPRTWQWTWNAQGQPLSQTHPAGSVTTLGYHPATTAQATLGDLAWVRNARQQLIQYPRWSPHGHWLQQLDAGGVSTVRSFDSRQRLTGLSVAGQTRRFEWKPQGLLRRVVEPDGSWVELGWDAAQRLVRLRDALGQEERFTLDEEGRSRAQQWLDAHGAERRRLERSFDALGRVQQLTGRE